MPYVSQSHFLPPPPTITCPFCRDEFPENCDYTYIDLGHYAQVSGNYCHCCSASEYGGHTNFYTHKDPGAISRPLECGEVMVFETAGGWSREMIVNRDIEMPKYMAWEGDYYGWLFGDSPSNVEC